MNPACTEFEPELSAYIDDELAAEARAKLEAHVSHCRTCTVELQRLRRTSAVLRRFDAHETASAGSTGFRNRVVARIAGDAPGAVHDAHDGHAHSAPSQERTSAHVAAGKTGRVLRIPQFSPLVAAAAAAAVVTVAIAWNSFGPESARSADLRDLETRVAGIRQELAARAANRPDLPVHGDGAPIAPDRLAAPDRVVSAEPAAAPASPEQPWDDVGDGTTILREARPALDDFRAEQSRITFEERIRAITQNMSAPGPHPTPTETATVVTPVAAWLGSLRVADAKPVSHKRVHVWAIEGDAPSRDAPKSSQVLLAADAIDLRILTIREDENGNVIAVNGDRKHRSVLLVAGDVLRGPRQDRVVSEDVIIGEGRSAVLRVFTSGRPRDKSTSYRAFTKIPLVAPMDLRALFNDGALGQPVAQGDVDDAVAASVTTLASLSNQGSLYNLAANNELQDELRRYVEAFKKRLDRPGVVGFAISAGPRLLAVELAGDPATFQALRDRVLASHVLTALAIPEPRLQGPPPSDSDVAALVAAARNGVFADPGVAGDGAVSAFRSTDSKVFGYGLLHENRVLHAVVFNGVPGGPTGNGPGRRSGPTTSSGLDVGGTPEGPDGRPKEGPAPKPSIGDE